MYYMITNTTRKLNLEMNTSNWKKILCKMCIILDWCHRQKVHSEEKWRNNIMLAWIITYYFLKQWKYFTVQDIKLHVSSFYIDVFSALHAYWSHVQMT